MTATVVLARVGDSYRIWMLVIGRLGPKPCLRIARRRYHGAWWDHYASGAVKVLRRYQTLVFESEESFALPFLEEGTQGT